MLCIGDPRIKEKMELDVDVAKLKLMEANFKNQQFALEDKLRKGFPCVIAQTEQKIQSLEQDAAAAEKTQKQDFSITILGKTYGLDAEGKPRKQETKKALQAAAQALRKNQETIFYARRCFFFGSKDCGERGNRSIDYDSRTVG